MPGACTGSVARLHVIGHEQLAHGSVGRIGRRVAEICALGLKMRVLVYDPYLTTPPPMPEGVQFIDDLDTIISEGDFVTLHVPLLPNTRHTANERRLRLKITLDVNLFGAMNVTRAVLPHLLDEPS